MILDNLSREMQRTSSFQIVSLPLKETMYNSDPQMMESIRSFIDATSNFGLAELYARTAERTMITSSFSDLKKMNEQRCEKYNAKGLRQLEMALSSLKKAERSKSDKPNSSLNKASEELQQELMEFYTEYEIKTSDIVKLKKLTDEAFLEMSKSENGVFNLLESKMLELQKLRSGKDRGAIDNIPFWKIAGIAIFIGFGIYALWACIIRRRGCSAAESNAAKIGMTIGGLLTYYC